MRLLLPFITAVALSAGAAISYVWGQETAVRAGNISVGSGWARATPPGASVGVAYLELHNHGGEADRLVGVDSPVAGNVMLHRTEESGGVAQMRPAEEGIVLPPGATVAMAPGGIHIMLMQLRSPLKSGDTLPLALRLETAGPLTLSVPIEPAGSPGPHDGAAHSGH